MRQEETGVVSTKYETGGIKNIIDIKENSVKRS